MNEMSYRDYRELKLDRFVCKLGQGAPSSHTHTRTIRMALMRPGSQHVDNWYVDYGRLEATIYDRIRTIRQSMTGRQRHRKWWGGTFLLGEIYPLRNVAVYTRCPSQYAINYLQPLHSEQEIVDYLFRYACLFFRGD